MQSTIERNVIASSLLLLLLLWLIEKRVHNLYLIVKRLIYAIDLILFGKEMKMPKRKKTSVSALLCVVVCYVLCVGWKVHCLWKFRVWFFFHFSVFIRYNQLSLFCARGELREANHIWILMVDSYVQLVINDCVYSYIGTSRWPVSTVKGKGFNYWFFRHYFRLCKIYLLPYRR